MGKFTYCLVIGILLFSSQAFAAGTCTQEWRETSPGMRLLQFICVADAANGSYPSTITAKSIDGYIVAVITNPGTVQPTDNWDATLIDSEGLDVTGGALTDRDTLNTERVVPKNDTVNNVFAPRYTHGKLTLAITNNSVNSAAIVISVYVTR